MDPILTIINSTIGAEVDITDLDNPGLEFKIALANVQRDKNCIKKVVDEDKAYEDCDKDGCYFNYMGQVKINKNRFTFLPQEAITILNSKMLEFYGNTVEFNQDNSLYLANAKSLNVSGNRFEFVGKAPALQIVYKEKAIDLGSFDYFPDNTDFSENEFEESEDCKLDKYSGMKKDKIGNVKIIKNMFSKLHEETIKFKIDEDYGKDFAAKKFKAEETSNRKPCKCPIPEVDEDADVNTNLTMMALSLQHCLSPQHPPVLGKRKDICTGIYPRSLEEKLEEAKKGIQPWHLILAILLAIIITAIMVFVIVRFCCMFEEGKSRTVSPIP